MKIEIKHVTAPGVIGAVNANADALIKTIKIGAKFMAKQREFNKLMVVEAVCLLAMSVANNKWISICEKKCDAKCMMLAKEIDKLKAEKNTAVEETEM